MKSVVAVTKAHAWQDPSEPGWYATIDGHHSTVWCRGVLDALGRAEAAKGEYDRWVAIAHAIRDAKDDQ